MKNLLYVWRSGSRFGVFLILLKDAFFPNQDGCWVGRKKTIFNSVEPNRTEQKLKRRCFHFLSWKQACENNNVGFTTTTIIYEKKRHRWHCIYIGRECNPSLEREGEWRRGRRGKERRRAWRSCGRHLPIHLSHTIISFATVPIPISSIFLLFLKRKKNELLQFAEQFSGGGFIAQGGAMSYRTTSSSSLMSAAFSDSLGFLHVWVQS